MIAPHRIRVLETARMVGAVAALAVAVLAAPPRVADAKTWRVVEGDNYQETIDSAAYGDTVMVGPGTYKRIMMRTGVKIISEKGPAETILRHNTFWVVHGEVVDSLASIEGFTIDGEKGAEAVVFGEDSQFLVKNCTLQRAWSGVRMLYSNLRVDGCTIRDCQNGLYLNESQGIITSNDIQLCYTGMTIVSSNPRILRNSLTRNTLGLYVQKHSDPEIGGTISTANRIWNNAKGAIRNDTQTKEEAVRTLNAMTLRVPFNFWGSDCPDTTLFRGLVVWAPWVDESGTRSLDKCPKTAKKK